MYQHFNTRRRLIKRIIAYFFMVSAIIVGVAGATVWIMGYRFDLEEQAIGRISLLQFQTTPGGAQIYVNDNQLNFRTPGRDDSIKPGANSIKYALDGYRDWNKIVNLRPAEVRWLNYARLVPNEIKTEPIADFSGYHQALNSPNGNWILLHQLPTDRNFKLIDISDPQNIRITDLVVPDSILGLATGTFEIIEWDSNSSHILLQRNLDSGSEIIRLDRREVNSSVNLTRLFGATIADPHFLNNDSNIVFGLTESAALRRFEINSKTISVPLVSNVSSYRIYGDGKLSYVATKDEKQIVGVRYKDDDFILREYDLAQPTYVNFVHYYRTDYLAIARDGVITIIDSPLNKNPNGEIVIETPAGVDWLMHSGGGRFIVAGRGENLVSYDLETNESFNFNLGGLSGKPKWVDDYHLYFIADGKMVMSEFDGANMETLFSAVNFGIFSNNNDYLLSFRIDENGAVKLQRSLMIII
jgi:hypothetical protein